MTNIFQFPPQERASSSFLAAKAAKTSRLISGRPRSAAKATTEAQCGAGMPRDLQPLTVERDWPSASATSPSAPGAVPLRVVMSKSQSMGDSIVRALRTSQGFAECETTFFGSRGAIEPMEPDSDEAVGRRIIALREKVGMQQQTLARELNMAKSTLNAYERGTRPLTMESTRRIRHRFGVTVDWLLFGDMKVTGRDLMLEIGPDPGATVDKKVRVLRK